MVSRPLFAVTVLCCIVLATAVSCDSSMKGHGSHITSTPLSGSMPPMETAATSGPAVSAPVQTQVKRDPPLAADSVSVVDDSADIIARMTAPGVCYAEFAKAAEQLLQPPATESPETWLSIVHDTGRDPRVRTIALFLFLERHVRTPITVHDLYHTSPTDKVLPSMRHAFVTGGRAVAFFPLTGRIHGILILDTDYLVASEASILVALSGDTISREDVDALLADASGGGKKYVCTEFALILDGKRWPDDEGAR